MLGNSSLSDRDFVRDWILLEGGGAGRKLQSLPWGTGAREPERSGERPGGNRVPRRENKAQRR
jgi:hypothetical protein